ncbi:secreted RxLR effector protein 161-like [Nicotiana tomentosiformis]|uniref:secreted RxLR effector protein 161-like n=1 Tax=Nicotiana tomentosiformis TaxID=4098 RepID=UPI00388C78DD
MIPQQNGMAERMNRTLWKRARCMILNVGLTNVFWAEAISTTCYIVNRAPSTPLNFKALKKIWSCTPINYSDLKIFGCPAYMHLSAAQSPQSEEEKRYMVQVLYSSVVSSIMYAMVCTRPDISQAVSVVSRFMTCPGKAHWHAVKWILRYLRGTSNTYLEFGRNTNTLVSFVDSDYASDLDKRRSLTGYVFCIGGCAIS